MNSKNIIIVSLIAFVALAVWAFSEPNSVASAPLGCTTHCVDHGVVTSSY